MKQTHHSERSGGKRLKALYQGLPIATIIFRRREQDFEIIDYNEACVRFTGGEIHSLLGRLAGELYQDRPNLLNDIAQCYQERRPVHRETWYQMLSTTEQRFIDFTFLFIPPDLVLLLAEDHTAREAAQRMLQRTRLSFDYAGDMIYWISPQGRIVDVNDTTCSRLDYAKHVLLALSIGSIAPDISPASFKTLWHDLKQHGAITRETVYRPRTGPDIPVEMTLNYLGFQGNEYACIFARDITQRVQALAKLRDSEERYKGLVDNIAIGVALISPKMEILALNKQMIEWFPDIDPQQKPICYRSFNDPPRQKKCVYCPTALTLQDGQVHEAVTHTPAGERILNYRVVASPIKDVDGKVTAAIEMVEDITQRRKAEHEKESISLMSQLYLDAETLETVYRTAPKILAARFGYPAVAIELYDKADNQMICTGAAGLPYVDQLPLRLPVDQSISGRVATTGQALAVAKLAPTNGNPHYAMAQLGFETFLGVPLTSGEQVLGTLWLADQRQRPHAAELLETLQIIGNHLALEIERRKIRETLTRQSKINAAMAELSEMLMRGTSIEQISSLVLEHACRFTQSPYGYAGYIDPVSGRLICPALTREIWERCIVTSKQIVRKRYTGLWGWVMAHRRPLLTNQAEKDPRTSGLPKGHGRIKRFLAVPALLGSKLMGQIALANAPQDFTAEDLEIAQRLAALYAMALDRHKMEKALRESREKLRKLSSSLMKAQEQERQRIAFGLHDDVAQDLAALKMQLRSIANQTLSQPGEAGPAMQDAYEQVNRILESVRRLSHGLSPIILHDLGLLAAIDWLIRNFEVATGMEVTFDAQDIDHLFSREQQVIVYRIFQEALNNIRKHAQASIVSIAIHKTTKRVSFIIQDNGIGFNMEEVAQRSWPEKGLGLTAMEERARILGGPLERRSMPGAGTRISFMVPIHKGGEQ